VETKGKEETSSKNPDILSLEEQQALRFRQDTKHRNTLVWWMMSVVSMWLLAVLLITAFISVDAKVLCILLATTTINILGLSKIILNGLFGERK